jgi:hypothetical protein
MAAKRPGAAGRVVGREARDGARHHHALDAQIEHARALGDKLAKGREYQRGGRDGDANQDAGEEGHGRTLRTTGQDAQMAPSKRWASRVKGAVGAPPLPVA